MATAPALSTLIRRAPRRAEVLRTHHHKRAFGRARTRFVAPPRSAVRRVRSDATLFANTLIGGFWFVSLLIA